jgi:hypothetical protein
MTAGKSPFITMPPLLGDDEKQMRWFSVRFDSGGIIVEIIDEGGGAFLSITTDKPWRVEVEELRAFVEWAEAAIAAVDKNNGNAAQ